MLGAKSVKGDFVVKYGGISTAVQAAEEELQFPVVDCVQISGGICMPKNPLKIIASRHQVGVPHHAEKIEQLTASAHAVVSTNPGAGLPPDDQYLAKRKDEVEHLRQSSFDH